MKSNCWNHFYLAVVLLLLAGVLIGAESASAGLNDGLVGYYSLNACTPVDESGTGNNGTIVGNSQCVQGVNGSALRFNGYYDPGYVTIPNSPSLSFLDNFTFTVWFNIQNHTSMDAWGNVSEYGMHSIFAKAGDRNGLIVRTIRDTNDGLMRLLVFNGWISGPNYFYTVTTEGFGLNEWHMVTVTSGNGAVNVYFDCAQQSSTPTEQFKVNTSMQYMPLQLGIDQDAWWYPINGILDETRVYNRALNADEVKALYNTGGLGNCPGENQLPVANAGPDQTVNEGDLVFLNGSGSNDPDGDPLTYFWTQLAGTPVTLNLGDPINPSFTAPDVSPGGATFTFQLIVNDGTSNSDPSVVNITVKNVNHPPTANAGTDQHVIEGAPVTLDGTGSFDVDGDSLTYSWNQTGGPLVTLSDPMVAQPTFVAPPIAISGTTLKFTLTVNDGTASATDSVDIIVDKVNHPPVANAGTDQTVNTGSQVTLDGSASSDPDADPLSFMWTQTSGPSVALSNSQVAGPTFTAPSTGGTLVFQLVVNDGSTNSTPDTVTITVLAPNDPPACGRAMPSVEALWPPNHKLIPVAITGVTDANNDNVTIAITGVTQDEPINGLGDGDTSPDAVIQDDSVLLRAERSGTGTGRVYRVQFTADDGQGGTCAGSVAVGVPHSKQDTAIDDGQQYDSTKP